MPKLDTLYDDAEIVRAFTPYWFAGAGMIIILCAIFNSEKLVGDRFAYTIGAAGAFLASGAGGYSPQSRLSPQTRVGHADQIEIDNK